MVDATRACTQKECDGYAENRDAAVAGGSVAGRARRDLEKKYGKRIAGKKNYKQLPRSGGAQKGEEGSILNNDAVRVGTKTYPPLMGE